MTEIEKLEQDIAALEAQRATLSDAVVNASIASLREKQALLQAHPPTPATRQTITVLFADVSGFTAMSEFMDAEDVSDTMNALWQRLDAVILRHGGKIDKHIGDALMAWWGAEAAREDDSEQAIRAALAMQAEVSSSESAEASLRMRIGLNTGPVLLGAVGTTGEFTAMGDTVNLASRLEHAAPVGGVLISRDTYRYVRGVFDVTPQPPLQVKGKREPVQTYLVNGARPRPFRTVTRGVAGIETRTVGREAEARQLQAAATTVLAEHAVIWTQLVGEPGLGKSRLLGDTLEFLDLRPERFRLLRARAFQGDETQAFALARRLWFDRFQIAEDAPLAEAEARWLEQFLALRGDGFEESAHALGLLVGLPFADSSHIGAMRDSPAQVLGRAIVVSREVLAALRAQQPVVILLEDLHWADQSSWDYLMRVIFDGEAQPHGLFILATTRPEWSPPERLQRLTTQSDGGQYVEIGLAPLAPAASRELVAELLRSVEAAPDDLVELIIERSEGVPYFAEEIVNWFLDRGVIDQRHELWRVDLARLNESPLPATLHHLLLTRLTALRDSERIALQRGAIFGRNFWESGLEALGVPAGAHILRQLQPRNFVAPQPESSLAGEREWSFHHHLLHEVTYESVLKRERRRLHKTAAEWLEAQARQANRLDEFAGLLAEHAERAGETNAAVGWYLRAGERAKAQGATHEARRFFERALELAPSEDRERRWRALLGRSDALGLLGDTHARQANLEALLQLAQQLDDARLAEALYRQGNYWDSRGDYQAAIEAYDTAIVVARRAGSRKTEGLVLAIKCIGQNRLGDDHAAATAQAALALISDVDEAAATRIMNNVAVYYVESGDLAQAAHLHVEQAAINRRLGDRTSEANALSNLGYDYVLLGMYDSALQALERALQINQAIGARREGAYALLNLGLTYWRLADDVTAQKKISQGRDTLGDLHDAFGYAAGLSYLGLVLEHVGDMTNAQASFEQARDAFVGLGVAGYAHDALVGRARCALTQGNLDEARQCATEVWGYLEQHQAQGLEFPVRAYLTCAEVFEALGEADKSRAAIEAGRRELAQRAGKISDVAWRQSFLENVSEHQAIRQK